MHPSDYELDLPSSSEEILNEINNKPGQKWATVSLSPHSAWVRDLCKVWFKEHYIYLIPLKDAIPAYATTTIIPTETYEETHNILSSFLSSLSWLENIPLAIRHRSGGGWPNPLCYPGQAISMLISSFDKENLQDPSDRMAKNALAFYRVGLNTRNVFESFLNFFKIINIVERSGKAQQKWINSKLTYLGTEATARITELRKTDPNLDIGQYLYKLGRCAIAHANENDPTADPDDFNDLKRLKADCDIVKELSTLAIEEKFAIKSQKSLRKEPKCNISGLINTFDEPLLSKGVLKTDLPHIILNIKGKEQNCLTQRLLLPEKFECNDNIFIINAITPDGRAVIRLSFDLDKNDVFIDPDYAVYKTSAVEDRINAEISLNALLLIRDYMHGGQLRIYSNEGDLLAYGSPYQFRNLHEFRSFRDREKQIEDARLVLDAFNENEI